MKKEKRLPLDDISWDKSEKKILIFTGREKIYRRSSKAFVYAYDLQKKQAIKIDDEKIIHATYSPGSDKVAFVRDNNLYYKDLITNRTTAITKDGEWNKIINGSGDWVYEEEFEVSKAYQWSRNGTHIGYYKFDESRVPELI
jgi:dipeptidyl-peptidase-4